MTLPSKVRATFLAVLREAGNVTVAADAAGMSRSQAYRMRDLDPAFAEQWHTALRLGAEALEDEAMRRAMAGSDLLLMFLLRAHKPERYRERSSIDVTGKTGEDIRRLPVVELKAELACLLALAADPTTAPNDHHSEEPNGLPVLAEPLDCC